MGTSAEEQVKSAVAEACRDFPETPQLLLLFSDGERFVEFTEELHRRYPRTTVMGASTYASFAPGGICRHGLNIAALFEGIHVSAGVIREITRYPGMIYQDLVRQVAEKLPFAPKEHNTCCFLLNPAGTTGEEAVLDMMSEALDGMEIPVFGGSASSEICARGSVSLNGETYANSTVFAFFQLENGRFQITQENIFKPMGQSFQVTKAQLARRTVTELNGRPAADMICQALGASREELCGALAEHPFGLMREGQLMINEVERVNEDGSITGYCRFFEGSEVFLLEACAFLPTMRSTFQKLHQAMPQPVFTIAVNCYSRTQRYLKNGWMEAFTQEMEHSLGQYLGFTSHGEQLGGYQLNLTLLLLSFGER